MNKQHTWNLQSCKFLFTVLVALFFINGNLLASHADLELTMTSPNPNPGLFANVDIEITITNHGPDVTNDVLLEFPFPSDLPITGDPVETQGFFSNWWTGTGTWTVGTLAPGQTETVTLTLFTLAEDLFFYGQVVNSSVVDNDSTPDNGTPPNPNEDDEAVVNINDTGGGNCEVNVLISNIICDDFNTPNIEYDDIFTFDVTVTGQNTSSQWTATFPSTNGFPPTVVTESYGTTITFAYNIAEANTAFGGIVNFTVEDVNDHICSEDMSVIVPSPCSPGAGCSINGFVSNVECFDGGTPNNPNDDQWSFDLTVNGTNTGSSWMAVINNQTYSGNYGEATSLGLFPIADGDLFVALMDSNNPACVDGITAYAPPTCSFGGSILPDLSPLTTQAFVNTNQTALDLFLTYANGGNAAAGNHLSRVYFSTDALFNGNDILLEEFFFTGSLGINEQTSFSSTVPIPSGVTSGDYFILFNIDEDGEVAESSEFNNVGVFPITINIGNQCNITATIVSVDCNSQGNNNPDDDTWSYTVQVDGTDGNPNDNDWVTSIPFGLPGAGGFILGEYGETFTSSEIPLNSSFQSVSHLIRSVADLNCSTTISIDAPAAPCNTTGCSITASVVSVDCNTQGNTNPNDDTWSFIVDVDGTNTSNNWSATVGNATFIGTYAQNFSREELPLTGSQVLTQTIMDSANPNCNTTVSINPPFPCSNEDKPDLELSMTSNNQPGAFQNISFDITVTNTGNAPANGVSINTELPEGVVLQGGNECDATGGNTNCFVSSVSWFFTTIAPGQTETLTVNFFTLTADPITYWAQVSDMNGEDEDSTPANGTPPLINEDDEAAFTIGDIAICDITGPFYNNVVCFDNGTPTTTDDYFNFEIVITNSTGTAYNLTTNSNANGIFNYDQTVQVIGFPYADLPFQLTATDVNDAGCFLQQNNNAFFPCSSGSDCEMNIDSFTKSCDDQGTSASADDTYTYEIVIFATGSAAGTGWTTTINGQTYTGFYGIPSSIGPFLINDGNISVSFTDNQSGDCTTGLTFIPPPPCSTGGGGDTDLKLEVTSDTQFAGSNVVTYTATITNEGNNDAAGVSMQFYQDGSFGIVGNNPSTGSFNFATDIWTVGTIAAGTSETIILEDQYVDFSAFSLPVHPFFEILTMDNNDSDSTPGNDNGNRTANEDDEAVLTIFPDGMGGYPSDLSLTLSTPSSIVNIGETFSIFCNINLENGAATTGVEANIILPPTVQYVGFTSTPGSFNANTGIWDVGYIGGLTNAEIEIIVTLIDDSQPSVFYGQITASSSFDFDSTPNNGTCCTPNEDDEAALTVTTGGVLKPDIIGTASGVTVSPNNDFINGDWTITNIGSASSNGFANRVYFSTDDQLSNNDELLNGIFSISAPFNVNATQTYDVGGVQLPSGVTPGDYFVLFVVDNSDNIDESNESNNVFAAPITITGTPSGADVELLVNSNSTFQQWDYVSFEISIHNTGPEPVSGLEIRLEDIAGGVLQGGNEGTATAGTFYPVGGAPSHWDLSGVTIQPNDFEVLTINCFVLDPNEISVYAQVTAMNQVDVDSTPDNGVPFTNGEDDEDVETLFNSSPLVQINEGDENTNQSIDNAVFKIQNLYPNPVNTNLKIAVTSALEQNTLLQITNLQGSQVAYSNKELVQGQNILEVDVSILPKGIYFLKIETKDGIEVKRFLKN